ncbi:hypothetical protein [Pedobacter alpinus]|uniref:Bacteriocin class II with double-glycine leader peptide n=1 Tax=Pedobacter alpinus TaxID=1590643 RepID=A0ABW5TMD7_9SPHI
MMSALTENEQEKIYFGGMQYAKAIAVTSILGGFFGGAGAVVGAAIAATGPDCLAWW